MKLKILIPLTLVIVLLGVRFVMLHNKNKTTEQPIHAVFLCNNGSSIDANFYNEGTGSVELTLSTGKHINIPHAVSADGARYANKDESFVFWNKGNSAFIEENGTTTFTDCFVRGDEVTSKPSTSMTNPASVNCVQKGGTSVIETRPDGAQYGLCYFEENRACEEWALLRGECPLGGRKTTGYDTEAQKFCAWSGGNTFAVDNAVCIFNDKSTCLDEAFYAGTCKKGDTFPPQK